MARPEKATPTTRVLKSGSSVMKFAAGNRAILSLKANGVELLKKSNQFFTLGFRNAAGDPVLIGSRRFKASGDEKQFKFSAHPAFPSIRVTVEIRTENGFYYFRPSVAHREKELILEWIDVPQLTVSHQGNLFWPWSEGCLIDDSSLFHKTWPLSPLGFPNGYPPHYPGRCQMQFMAHYDETGGVYFGAHDLAHTTKGIYFNYEGRGRTRLALQTFCDAENHYHSTFEYVIGAFAGDWMSACDLYREWARQDPALPRKRKLPQWLEESPVVMIYPVRGKGDDKGTMEPNEYFPYIKALPTVRHYAAKFKSRILALLMHWEGTAPWAPPYVWPPYGGTELLKDYQDALHAQGHLLGVYGSGTAWTQTSSITDYSREEQCEREGLRRYMIRGPKGEINAKVCNGPKNVSQRIGYDLCVAEEWSRETIKREIRKLAQAGIDYAQFFDQNLGGASHLCYSREHCHPPLPGRSQVESMSSLLEECVQEIRACGSEMILGAEAAAAEPYLKHLPFSDLRYGSAFVYGVPVPAYAYVYHEYVVNFLGNLGDVRFRKEYWKHPELLLYRTAYAFNAGDLLSILLKDRGKIQWGWAIKWAVSPPDQKSIIELVHNLNALRRQYPQFLYRGRMLRPLVEIKGATCEIPAFHRVVRRDSFFTSSWQAPDGKKAVFVTNFRMNAQRVKCTVPPGRAVRIDGSKRIYSGAFDLKIPPLRARVMHLVETKSA